MSRCIQEWTLDLKNYVEGGTFFRRRAVRGIIRRDGKYLVIHSKYGDYKFPGGGMKPGEEPADTLIREVLEETGRRVKAESIGDYFLIHERRKGDPDDLLEMDSWYYLCDVEETVYERSLDAYEREYDYQVLWLPLRDVIQENQAAEHCEKTPWAVREAMMMRRLWEMEEKEEI